MTKTKNKKILIILGIILVISMVLQWGYRAFTGKMAADANKRPPSVELMDVEEREIYDKLTSTGRIEAKYSVDVVARVQGWLKKSYFTEGSMVQKGAQLFLIEPDNYQIAVNQAKADLQKAQADYINAEKDLKRADELVKLDYVSKSYYDQALSKRDMAKATVAAARAALSNANLNLSYTRVYAPVTGKVGKILITQGNLVDPSAGAITKIVSVDPIYAYFTLKSEDYLNFQKHEEKNLKDTVVDLTLADGSTYEHKGKVEFINNEVDPSVGTIGLRATFNNPDGILVPSDYVNVTITAKKPRKVVLVPQEAVQESKDGMLVYTVNEESQAVPQIIEAEGQYDGQWIVKSGLKGGDKVIGKGLLSIKAPNQKVNVIEPKTKEAQDNQTKK